MQQQYLLSLNHYQIQTLLTYGESDLDQISDTQPCSAGNPTEATERSPRMLEPFANYSMIEAAIADLEHQLSEELAKASATCQTIRLRLSPPQIVFLHRWTIAAQDNLNDQSGGEWDYETPQEAKVQAYGTSDYKAATQLLEDLRNSLPAITTLQLPER